MPYSKEGEAIKDRFVNDFDEWFSGFFGSGEKPLKTPTNPEGKGITKGAANRAMNSFISSPDEVHLDYVDNRMTKGASVKSIVGGLRGRVQGLSQGKLSPYGVTPTDELHHGLNLSSYGPALRRQNGIIRLEFFEEAAQHGDEFGDSARNLGGSSLDPRAHTGSRGGAAKGTAVKAGYGMEGEQALSAHRRGTKDPLALDPNKQYTSGAEMYAEAAPMIEQQKIDLEVGKAADAPRRQFINKTLVTEGVIPKDVDVFAADANPESIAKAKKFLTEREDIMVGAAKVFDPKEARKLIKTLAGASLIVGPLGTAADAAETANRTELSLNTKNPVDTLQALISAASTAVGATGVGEVLGIPLEIINMTIDQHREGLPKIRGRSGAKRAIEKRKREEAANK